MSSKGQQNLHLELNEKTHHYQLKNLGFEESGHTGFQKELTEKQLGLIEKVKNKEDVSNRVTAISDKNTHEQYPSAKAVYDAVNECGEFELIEDVTLSENVAQILCTLPGKYKELYLRFAIPSSGNNSTDKARWRLQTLNDLATNVNKFIYDQGNQFVEDFTSRWYAGFHIKILGKYCRTELWYEREQMATGAYARGMNSSTYSGYVAPSVPMARDYIDRLKILFATSGNVTDGSVRYLPAGTKYEIWGVRK